EKHSLLMSLPPPPPPPPPLPPMRSLDRQGYLLRYETANGISGWKRRWAVLSDHCLYLYKDPDSKECLYALLLSTTRVTQSHDSTGQYRSSIKLEEPNQVAVYLSTGTPEEFDDWYQALLVATSAHQPQVQQRQNQISSGWAGHAQRHSDMYGSNYTVVTSSDLQRDRQLGGGGGSELRNYRRQLTVSQPNLDLSGEPVARGAGLQQPDYQLPYAVYSAAASSRGSGSLRRVADEPEEAHYAVVREPNTAAVWKQQQQQQQQQYQRQYVSRSVHVNNGVAPAAAAAAAGAGGGPRWTNGGSPAGNLRMIETVREDPAMDDTQVLATAPLEEIRRRYPVSGLAKRMSIAASDLLGKPHDELLLLLIQLQREKAALERRREHCLRLIGSHPVASATAERLRQEIREAEQQAELSEPLLSFIANIIAMGAMYQGDDLAFASEYRRHLLQPGQAKPSNPVIGRQRRRQEMEIARQCQSSDPAATVEIDIAGGGDSGDVEFRRTRRRLESELAALEAAYAEHRRRKSGLADFMAELGRRGTAAVAVTGANRRRLGNRGTYLETDLDTGECIDLAAKFPRRLIAAGGGVGGAGPSTARSAASSLRAAVSTPALNAVDLSGYDYGEADGESGYFGASGISNPSLRPSVGGHSEVNRRPRVEQALSVTSLNAPEVPPPRPMQQQPPPLPQRRYASNSHVKSVSVQEQLNSMALRGPNNVSHAEFDDSAAATDRKARIRRVLAGYSLQEFTRQELGGLSLAEERRRRELALAEREHVGTEASRLAVRGYLQ
ncbi:hypothetical protein BOX15_Mlig022620g3, partial [Macrostomum lignano]